MRHEVFQTSGAILAAVLTLPAMAEAQTNPPSIPRFAIRIVDEAVDQQAQTCPPRDDRVPNSILYIGQPGSHCLIRAGGIEGELAEADITVDPLGRSLGRPAVWFRLTPAGSAQFAALTTANVGHSFAVVVDGQTVFVAVSREPILDGRAELPVRSYAEEIVLAAEMRATVRDGGQ